MLSDFDIIIRRFDSAIKIACISDVHFGGIGHCEKQWKKFIKMVQEDPTLYLVLGGDLINNNVRSGVGSPWDDYIRPSEQKRMMVEFLEPIKHRVLCAVSGNHERRSLKDSDTDVMYDIMAKLDLEHLYRPNAAFMKIQIGQRTNAPNKGKCTYTFAVTHGTGGGQTGAAVNRNERWGSNIENVDCVISGHTHKGAVSKPMKMVFDPHNDKILFKQFVSVICVPWQEYVDFPLQKMMNPSTAANPQFLYLNDKEKNIEVRW